MPTWSYASPYWRSGSPRPQKAPSLIVIDNFLSDPGLDALFVRLAETTPSCGVSGSRSAQSALSCDQSGLRGAAADSAPQPEETASAPKDAAPDGAILQPGNIRVGPPAEPKEEAIRRAGELLVAGGYARPEYVDAMLRREKLATTCLGMGLAIPHGTSDAKERVLRSGIVILQYPDGVDFDGEKAHLIVGIAGVGDEHLEILARLSASFEDEEPVAAAYDRDRPAGDLRRAEIAPDEEPKTDRTNNDLYDIAKSNDYGSQRHARAAGRGVGKTCQGPCARQDHFPHRR